MDNQKLGFVPPIPGPDTRRDLPKTSKKQVCSSFRVKLHGGISSKIALFEGFSKTAPLFLDPGSKKKILRKSTSPHDYAPMWRCVQIPCPTAAAVWESNEKATRGDGLKHVLLLCKHKLPLEPRMRTVTVLMSQLRKTLLKHKTENSSSTHVQMLCSSTESPFTCHCTVKLCRSCSAAAAQVVSQWRPDGVPLKKGINHEHWKVIFEIYFNLYFDFDFF